MKSSTPALRNLPHNAIRLEGHQADVFKVLLLPGSEHIATACADNNVRIFSTASGERLNTLEGPEVLTDIAVTPGGSILCTGEKPMLLKWAFVKKTAEYVAISASISSPRQPRSAVESNPVAADIVKTLRCTVLGEYSFAICAEWDVHECPPGALRRWYQGKGLILVAWENAQAPLVRRSFKDDSSLVIAAYENRIFHVYGNNVYVYSEHNGCLGEILNEHSVRLGCMAIGEDYIATGSADGILRVSDAESFRLLNSFQAHRNAIISMQFRNDEHIISGSKDKTVALHDVTSGECLWRVKVGFRVYSVVPLPNNCVAAAGKVQSDGDSRISGALVFPDPSARTRNVAARGQKAQEDNVKRSNKFEVFISHAGPDKNTIAIPLYEALVASGIRTFVDREELKPGDDAAQSMIDAMETSPIMVVITSPEYCARKWTIKELACVLRRDEEIKETLKETLGSESPPPLPGECGRPIIVPVFYRLSVRQCKNLNLATDVRDEDEANMQRYWDMLNSMDPNLRVMRDCMAALGGWTGIENDRNMTNEDTDEMKELRAEFIMRIRSGVADAVEFVRSHSS